MSSLPIERRTLPTKEEFEREYLSTPGRPVILTEAMTTWPALDRWSFAFFAVRFGDRDVVAFDQLLAPKKALRMKLRTFLQYCEDPARLSRRLGDAGPLYVAFQPFACGSLLLGDFSWPAGIDNVYMSIGDEVYDWYLRTFGVLLIGPSGTITPWHEDLFGTHAWLGQIVGCKHFVFCAPDEAFTLGKQAATAARRNADCIDRCAEDAPKYEGVVNPGEMIVFPKGWSHCVTALSPSISLSFNFVNSTNILAHMLEIFRDLPAWAERLNSPALRKALSITWSQKDLSFT